MESQKEIESESAANRDLPSTSPQQGNRGALNAPIITLAQSQEGMSLEQWRFQQWLKLEKMVDAVDNSLAHALKETEERKERHEVLERIYVEPERQVSISRSGSINSNTNRSQCLPGMCIGACYFNGDQAVCPQAQPLCINPQLLSIKQNYNHTHGQPSAPMNAEGNTAYLVPWPQNAGEYQTTCYVENGRPGLQQRNGAPQSDVARLMENPGYEVVKREEQSERHGRPARRGERLHFEAVPKTR